MTDAARQDGGRAPPESLSRREMIATTAAALATPLLSIRGAAGPLPQGAAIAPRFLTQPEFALLDELTELVIPTDEHSPGARTAGVAAFIDGRLAESLEPEWQALWRSGLEAVEGLARERHQKPFLDATPDQRVEILTAMAAGERDPKTPMDRFFHELKQWTARGYYTSKIGIHLDQEYKGNVSQPGDYAGYDAT